ncbi:acetyl-CoA C-acetyltransferase [Lewinella aquimaris]|uniref:acetyl-CoA C-acetyltransferase n=1 Tax=Neolewinella aquimaris TaxID=1835722 RepID=A0A840E631_9BACT|nr:acetyl-CoA C-acyltransferase [Neolewinella aquimaris]MBB4078647.1 acetyl-CoA C-acetyltransferase [Neolewinella aquimaris]
MPAHQHPPVYIVSAVRTPIGSFGGALASLSATQLGSAAIKGALERAGVPAERVQEVLMGNVVSSNLGQAPARQAALGAGIPNTVPCTTVNKVCSSGMKSVMLGAQSIMLGHNDIVVAGGMESMSNIPYYVADARWGAKFGDRKLIDGLTKDGLTDAYDQQAMGTCADATASKYGFSREEQDEYATNSYKRSAEATDNGTFKREIVPVSIPQRRGEDVIVSEDEEYKKVKFDKMASLRPAFSKEGTVTAANASTINDGAAALVLVSQKVVDELGLKPLAKIVSFADAAHEPQWFTTAPTKAAPLAVERAGLTMSDMDFLEVNEAFAVVPMAFAKELGLKGDNMNVNGGGVSLGHPLGTSGARILVTLINTLHSRNGKYGLATLCNGGGGASAVVVEAL